MRSASRPNTQWNKLSVPADASSGPLLPRSDSRSTRPTWHSTCTSASRGMPAPITLLRCSYCAQSMASRSKSACAGAPSAAKAAQACCASAYGGHSGGGGRQHAQRGNARPLAAMTKRAVAKAGSPTQAPAGSGADGRRSLARHAEQCGSVRAEHRDPLVVAEPLRLQDVVDGRRLPRVRVIGTEQKLADTHLGGEVP